MAKVGSATLLPARFLAASITAVLMPAITTAADPKYRATLPPSANSLTQNIFSAVSHPHPKARLDNGRQSCQLNDGYLDNLSHERNCQWTPVGDTIGVSPARPSAKDYTIQRTIVEAPAARMMLRCLFRQVFRKTRF